MVLRKLAWQKIIYRCLTVLRRTDVRNTRFRLPLQVEERSRASPAICADEDVHNPSGDGFRQGFRGDAIYGRLYSR